MVAPSSFVASLTTDCPSCRKRSPHFCRLEESSAEILMECPCGILRKPSDVEAAQIAQQGATLVGAAFRARSTVGVAS